MLSSNQETKITMFNVEEKNYQHTEKQKNTTKCNEKSMLGNLDPRGLSYFSKNVFFNI